MCGIAGVVDKSGISHQKLNEISQILRHRGPEDEGFVSFNLAENRLQHYRGNDTVMELKEMPHISEAVDTPEVQIGFVHRRLSIIDLSVAGHQPYYFADQHCVLIFNGEIYNYREIKKELHSQGWQFTSESDTEVLLAAYYQWGADCVQRFVGMWAFAIWDSRNRTIFLSRDRFGIKPLYFSLDGDKFAFASEIKALLLNDYVSRRVHQENLSYYLYFNITKNIDETLFVDVRLIPAGHNGFYHFDWETIRLERYYDLKELVAAFPVEGIGKDPFATYAKYFEDAIDLHVRADVEIGSCLSGGLDSSSIVAIVAPKMPATRYNTFTAAYHNPHIDESHFAKQVSSHFPNIEDFYTYPSVNEFWEDLDKLVWHQDLPIQSTSIFAQWMVMKLAAEHHMKVLLDGQGADESLGGYDYFMGVYLLSLITHLKGYAFLKQSCQLRRNRSINVLTDMSRAALVYLPAGFQKRLKERYRISSACMSEEFRDRFVPNNFQQSMGKSFRDRCIYSMGEFLQVLLRYEDRNSMAFSIESRVPFLDHRLVELTLALDDQLKINNGWSKYVLRKAVEKKLPPPVVWRKDKKGFITPQKDWIGQSRFQLRELIEETDLPDFLVKNEMCKLLATDICDQALLDEFWKMIGLIKWCQVFKVEM